MAGGDTPGHTFDAPNLTGTSPGRWPALPARLSLLPGPCPARHPTHTLGSDFPSFSITFASRSLLAVPVSHPGHHPLREICAKVPELPVGPGSPFLGLGCLSPPQEFPQPPGRLSQVLCCFCPREYLKSNRNTNIWILDTSQFQPYLSYLALLLELGPEEALNDLSDLTCCA